MSNLSSSMAIEAIDALWQCAQELTEACWSVSGGKSSIDL
jgi:hypothetical protein